MKLTIIAALWLCILASIEVGQRFGPGHGLLCAVTFGALIALAYWMTNKIQ